MTKWLKKMNVKKQLVTVVLLLLLPVIITSWFVDERSNDILKQQVTDAYVELIKQNHKTIELEIDTVNRVMTNLIQHNLTQQILYHPDSTVIERVRHYTDLDNLLSSYSIGVAGAEAINYSMFVLDPDRENEFAAKVGTTKRGVYFVDDQNKPYWYDEAIALKGKGVMRVIQNFEISSKPTLAYIRAVNKVTYNQPIGVLVATNMDKKINQSLNSVSFVDGESMLIDNEQNILASTNRSIGEKATLPSQWKNQKISLSEKGIKQTEYLFEGDNIYLINHNELQGRNLFYRLSAQSLTLQQKALRINTQLLSTVYILLATVIMLYFLRSLIRPLFKLTAWLKLYEPGDQMPKALKDNRKDEVGVLVNSIEDMTERLNLLVKDKYEMELKQKEMQLQTLYEQINPHMLYNTLESIYWKSELSGDPETAEMIKELSRLIKIGLSRGRDMIHVAEEMEHVAAYLGLQQKRYTYQFKVIWEIQEEVKMALMPKITIQPLVENAILHGVRYMDDEGEIKVKAISENEHLLIIIEDNGYKNTDFEKINALLELKEENNSGYGIRNVHSRIHMHFGANYGLTYMAGDGQGTKVMMRLPLIWEAPYKNEK